MIKECTLTTVDNPFNPFVDFTSWLMFDIEKGYNSCGKLARLTDVKDDMTPNEANAEVERAVDRIIELDFLGIYKKIYRD